MISKYLLFSLVVYEILFLKYCLFCDVCMRLSHICHKIQYNVGRNVAKDGHMVSKGHLQSQT